MAAVRKVPRRLAERLKQVLDEKHGGDSAIVADMHDIYEICVWYIDTVDRTEAAVLTDDEMSTMLVDMEIQLLWHLVYHQKSIRTELRRAIEIYCTDDEQE